MAIGENVTPVNPQKVIAANCNFVCVCEWVDVRMRMCMCVCVCVCMCSRIQLWMEQEMGR